MSVVAQFSIFPVDKGDSLSEYVAGSLKIIKKSGLPYEPGPMGTSMEGDWDDIIKVVTRCFREMKKNSGRVYMTMSVDYRSEGKNRLKGKVASVKAKMD